jgi:hypothetical protein
MTQPPYWADYGGNRILGYALTDATLYVAAHQADPTPAEILSTELAGDGYLRAPLSFTDPSGRTVVNAVGWKWHSLPASVITHFGLWTGQIAGHLVFVHPLRTPLSIPASGYISVAAHEWAIGV